MKRVIRRALAKVGRCTPNDILGGGVKERLRNLRVNAFKCFPPIRVIKSDRGVSE